MSLQDPFPFSVSGSSYQTQSLTTGRSHFFRHAAERSEFARSDEQGSFEQGRFSIRIGAHVRNSEAAGLSMEKSEMADGRPAKED